jgi:predicted RNA polymerase sigma factor
LVQHVLYLLFNEGYASSSGPELARTDLSGEAIRLARDLRQGQVGEYQVQAAIAAIHDQAARHSDTDWSEILPCTACSNE